MISGILNPDKPIELKIGNDIFMCKPPVDAVAMEVFELYDSGEDAKFYTDAKERARKKLTAPGARIPPKDELEKQVEKIAKEELDKVERNMKDELKRIDEVIDLVVIGWTTSDGKNEFPEDGKPHRWLTTGAKQKFSTEYMKLMSTQEDEVKN